MPAPVLAPGARLTEGGGSSGGQRLRISDHEAAAMLACAFFYDAGQFFTEPLIVVPYFFSLLAFCMFGVWFAIRGINYFTGKQAAMKLIAIFGTLVIDIIPFINGLPEITAGVFMMIAATRIEDTVGKKRALERRLRSRQFWQGVTENRFVNAATGGMAEQIRAGQEEKARNRMAAQYAYGRKQVTREEAKDGISAAYGQMQQIESEAPDALIDKPSERGDFDSRREDLRRRYLQAKQYRDSLKKEYGEDA